MAIIIAATSNALTKTGSKCKSVENGEMDNFNQWMTLLSQFYIFCESLTVPAVAQEELVKTQIHLIHYIIYHVKAGNISGKNIWRFGTLAV